MLLVRTRKKCAPHSSGRKLNAIFQTRYDVDDKTYSAILRV